MAGVDDKDNQDHKLDGPLVISGNPDQIAEALASMGVPAIVIDQMRGMSAIAVMRFGVSFAADGLFDTIHHEDESEDEDLVTSFEMLPDGTITAVGRMWSNARWTPSMAHSSDMMFSTAEFVDHLLGDKEEVTAVESMRFLDKVKGNLQMYACVGELSEVMKERCAKSKPNLQVVFLTRNSETGEERKINFLGFKNGEPMYGIATGMEDLPLALVRGFNAWEKLDEDRYIFDLSNPPENLPDTGLGGVLNAVMEVVLQAFSKLKNSKRNPFPKSLWHAAYNFQMKSLPEVKDLDDSCKLELFIDRTGIVEKPNGFRFLPVKFAIKRAGKVICEGIYTNAQPMTDEVARTY